MGRIAPYLVIALLLGCIGSYFAGERKGAVERDTYWKGEIAAQRAEAADEARKAEREQQKEVSDALESRNRDLAGINARLARDIDRLRQRPERPAGVPEAPRPGCQGANGAELGGEHASLLARLAVALARYDREVRRCYESYDAVSGAAQ